MTSQEFQQRAAESLAVHQARQFEMAEMDNVIERITTEDYPTLTDNEICEAAENAEQSMDNITAAYCSDEWIAYWLQIFGATCESITQDNEQRARFGS